MIGLGNTVASIESATIRASFTNSPARGGSVTFDGTDDYINYGSLPTSVLDTLETKGTMACWMHIDGDSGGSSFPFAIAKETTDYLGLWWHNYYNEPRGSIKGNNVAKHANPSTNAFGTGTNNGSSNYITAAGWYFMALSYNNVVDGEVVLYAENLSGELHPTTLSLGSSPAVIDLTGTEVWVGARKSGSGIASSFHGLVSYAAIWDTNLNEDSITALWNEGTPVDATKNTGNYLQSSNLVFFDNMQTGAGRISYTIVGANNGTTANDAAWSTASPTN